AQIDALREIERLGAVVTAVAADVADAGSVAALIQRFGADLPPLRGVIHAAAVIDPKPTGELTAEQVEATLRPKVAGARNLHRATLGLDLDFFILFSTAAAVWGSRGLAHYAAANHFLDALAHHRAARGLPALAVNWGLWAEGATTEEMNRFFRASGVLPMPSRPLFELLGSLAANGAVQRTIARVDWAAFRAAYEQRGRRALLAGLDEGEQVEPDGRTGQAATELMQQLRGASPARAREILVQHV